MTKLLFPERAEGNMIFKIGTSLHSAQAFRQAQCTILLLSLPICFWQVQILNSAWHQNEIIVIYTEYI